MSEEEAPSAPPPRTVSLMEVSFNPPDKALPPLPPGQHKEKNKLLYYLFKKPGLFILFSFGYHKSLHRDYISENIYKI